MSKFTDFLNLFKWDAIEDSEEEFNIDKTLNENWDKIDIKLKTHITNVNQEISEHKLETKTSIDNLETEVNTKIDNIEALPTRRNSRTSTNQKK